MSNPETAAAWPATNESPEAAFEPAAPQEGAASADASASAGASASADAGASTGAGACDGAGADAPRRQRTRVAAAALAGMVLVAGLVASGVGWRVVAHREQARADQDFARFAGLATSHVAQRVQHAQDLLVAVAAPFGSAAEPSRVEFNRLVSDLRLAERLPEVRALQWSRRVIEEDRAAFELRVRHDRSLQPEGYPAYQIHPPGPRPDYVAVEFNEPMAGNERAFGHDNAAETARREQIERARDAGQPAASPPLQLLQGDLGWILRVPVYHAGAPLDTVAQRRAAFKGLVSGVLRADLLLRDVADAGSVTQGYEIVVRDQGLAEPAADAPVATAVELAALRRTPTGAASGSARAQGAAVVASGDKHSQAVAVAGRVWAIEVMRAPLNHAWQALPLTVLGGGSLLTLLAALALWRQGLRVAQSRTLAEQSHAHARSATERLDAIIEHTADGIVTLDLQGTVLGANRAAEAMFGLERARIVGQTLAPLLPAVAEAALPHDPLAGLRSYGPEGALSGRRETTAQRADGTPFAIEINISTARLAGGTQIVCTLRDLTDAKAADEAIAMTMQELNQATELQEAMLRHAAFAIVLLDRAGTVRAFNPAAARLLGVDAEAVLNCDSFARFFDGAEMARLVSERAAAGGTPVAAGVDFLAASVAERASVEHELHLVRGDGQRVPVSLTVSALRDETQAVAQLLLIAYDVTTRRQMVAEMTQLAYTDRLTGLANRGEFERAVPRALFDAQRRGTPMALLYIDLDRFKPINDTHGHAMGDKVLCTVAARLRAAVRTSDLVARLGGDEFVVLLPTLSEAAASAVVAEKILAALSEPMHLDGHSLQVGASIGIVTWPEGGETAEALLGAADAAMYAAKQAGRNCFRQAPRVTANADASVDAGADVSADVSADAA